MSTLRQPIFGPGRFRPLAAAPAVYGLSGGADPLVAGFGWIVSNLDDNGADVYFEVESAMTLNSVNIDVAFSPNSTATAGFAEVLCQGAVSRGAVPTFNNTGGHAYLTLPASSNFGAAVGYNPNGLTINYNHPAQDRIYSVILKTYVPSDGSASATYRQFLANSSLSLSAGDYLAFHMDHVGVPGNAEMHVVLQYSLS